MHILAVIRLDGFGTIQNDGSRSMVLLELFGVPWIPSRNTPIYVSSYIYQHQPDPMIRHGYEYHF